MIPLVGIPEIEAGDDLAGLLLAASERLGGLADADVVVVAQKAVSKAEGRVVRLEDVEPSAQALELADERDPRHVEWILRESAKVVRVRPPLIIAETRHGFICANAAVDNSNVEPEFVCLLPEDSDASAARIRDGIRERTGLDVPVIISDSFGRPWRYGIVNVAIGVSGLNPLADYRGQQDTYGQTMHASILAVADELASAAELVAYKFDSRPVALIRGYQFTRAEGSYRDLLMDPTKDLFR